MAEKPNPLVPGTKAPQFKAETYDGKVVSLEDYRGSKVALYFYPKDNTPGCTKQACNLRDNTDLLEANNIKVIGVSPDDNESHEKFSGDFSLDFPLVADVDHSIAEAYGVWGEKNNYGKTYVGISRTTFVIDEEGIIQLVIKRPNTAEHAEEIVKKLNDLG